jgi:hypothetical protein
MLKKIEQLEKIKEIEDTKVTIEQHGIYTLVKWGETVVKILRGVSMDDL